MCRFCEDIYENGDINGNTAFKYNGMALVKENGIFKISYLMRDEYGNDACWIIELPIIFCPMCGRKLVEE